MFWFFRLPSSCRKLERYSEVIKQLIRKGLINQNIQPDAESNRCPVLYFRKGWLAKIF